MASDDHATYMDQPPKVNTDAEFTAELGGSQPSEAHFSRPSLSADLIDATESAGDAIEMAVCPIKTDENHVGPSDVKTSHETVLQPRTINIILFGETSVGKRSVINLIAGKQVANISKRTDLYLLQTTHYDVHCDDMHLSIFDTIGLEETDIDLSSYYTALHMAYELVVKLRASGGVHLLLFVLRGKRVTSVTESNYQLFLEVICRGKVPIMIVSTGLKPGTNPDSDIGLPNSGYARLTAIQNDASGEDPLYLESRGIISELLKRCYLKRDAFLLQEHAWLGLVGRGMRRFIYWNREPYRFAVIKVLVERCNLVPETAVKLVSFMEEENEPPVSEDDEGRSQHVFLTAAQGQEEKNPGPGKLHDKPQTLGLVELVEPRHLDGAEEGENSSTGNKVQEGPILAGKSKLEPENVPPVKKDGNNETLTASQSNLPSDLTGQVTKSSTHPFTSGGFGDIYKGSLNVRGKSIDVAIKTTRVYLQHDQYLPKKVKQFRREVSVWSKLSHPNVLPLLGIVSDSSTHPDIPAMVCPWIENGALSTYLATNNLTLANKLVLINDVAHGLQYLHSQSVVHGDLTGSNVLVTGDGRACIADFGLSMLLTQLSGSTLATTHQAKGTVRWMAPELLDTDNSEVTPTMQTDVYSFGSVTLQILTGNVPYHYLPRIEQVLLAMVKGETPRRPDPEVVTDQWWKFIEWCWSPPGAAKPRPSGDEVLEWLFAFMATAK